MESISLYLLPIAPVYYRTNIWKFLFRGMEVSSQKYWKHVSLVNT